MNEFVIIMNQQIHRKGEKIWTQLKSKMKLKPKFQYRLYEYLHKTNITLLSRKRRVVRQKDS